MAGLQEAKRQHHCGPPSRPTKIHTDMQYLQQSEHQVRPILLPIGPDSNKRAPD